MKINLFYRLPVLFFCLLIFWQSHFPSIGMPARIPFSDKIMHCGAYAVMAFLVARWLQEEKSINGQRLILIISVVFTALFGLSDEFHQSFIDGRTASVFDFFADCVGAFLGACFFDWSSSRK